MTLRLDTATSRWIIFALASLLGASALAPSFQHLTSQRMIPQQQQPLFSTYYNDFDDFNTSSTVGSAESDDPLMVALRNRQKELENASTRLPLIILDSMLPRQVLDIQLSHQTLKNLIKHRTMETEQSTLGMLGMIRTTQGFVPLTNGVEVEIAECDQAKRIPGDTTGSSDKAWDVTLVAKRRFRLKGQVNKTDGGWTESQVEYLDSEAEEEMQQKQSEQVEGQDPLSLAKAISKSRQFTQPNANIPNNLSIVERWIELARQNERHPNQIDKLLSQLGEIPPEHKPSERAFWIGALINPLPALGVAMEIRPSLLMSKTAEERGKMKTDCNVFDCNVY